jgi:hypothetical protein
VGVGRERPKVTITRRAVSLTTILAEFPADIDGKSDGAPRAGGRVSSCRHHVLVTRREPVPGLILSGLPAPRRPRLSRVPGLDSGDDV